MGYSPKGHKESNMTEHEHKTSTTHLSSVGESECPGKLLMDPESTRKHTL